MNNKKNTYKVILFRKETCFKETIIHLILEGKADDVWFKGKKIERFLDYYNNTGRGHRFYKIYKDLIKDKKNYKFLIILKITI